jgi:zinc finger protein
MRALRDGLGDNPFVLGDAGDAEARQRLERLLARLDAMARADEPFTLVLDDPLAASYVQALDGDDRALTAEEYERTWEQDDELGLHGLNTDAS